MQIHGPARAWASIIALAWSALSGCSRDEPPPSAPAPPGREAFHASKPLRVLVTSTSEQAAGAPKFEWLEHELRYLLSQGRMRVAANDSNRDFTLHVELSAGDAQAELRLLAPDGSLERKTTVGLAPGNRLDVVRALAARLPGFVGAAHASNDWAPLIGTQNVDAYEAYVRSEAELLGSHGRGFTRPGSGREITRTIERLEGLTRKYPQFARAWSLLAVGYLSLGGEDAAALQMLAEASAERALSLDENLALAYAADGLVRLRRNDWLGAQGALDRSLAIDANIVPALEGLACLRVDAGQAEAALPFAARAVALQPGNAGANECQAYARATVSRAGASDAGPTTGSSVARMQALAAILSDDTAAAQKALRSSGDAGAEWAAPVLRASRNKRSIPEALQALTDAANEGRIDGGAEIMFGAALRQPDFVFNRMERLNRQGLNVPLRVLWLPRADFLRKHERFEQLVGKVGLPAYWQQSGVPEICGAEPATFGCKR
jgi:tetratricopeptide (TPR) repeat protein